jgi:hypothetical protein
MGVVHQVSYKARFVLVMIYGLITPGREPCAQNPVSSSKHKSTRIEVGFRNDVVVSPSFSEWQSLRY